MNDDFPSRPPTKIVRASQVEAWQQGFSLLDAVKTREQALEQTVAEAHQQARDEGYQAGIEEGQREALELVTQAQNDVDHYLAGLDTRLMDLCMSAIRRVLGQFDNVELMAQMVHQALDSHRDQLRQWQLSVPLGQAQPLRARLEQSDSGAQLSISEDPGLPSGRCLLGNQVTVIRLDMDQHLQRIGELLGASQRPEA
ncbi:hypothetical protein R84981_001238 [Carnimonas sp. R-84981]|uniref:hypothetical protein n=1 Tax=Carnimonas bestiolae TaxID=3402172 RepID=UPI003EDC539A